MPTVSPTFTPTTALGDKFGIRDVVLYPNQYNSQTGDLRISFDATRPAAKITIRIYTVSYRRILEKTIGGPFVRWSTLSIPAESISKFTNGVYYVLLSGESTEGEKAVSKPADLIILK